MCYTSFQAIEESLFVDEVAKGVELDKRFGGVLPIFIIGVIFFFRGECCLATSPATMAPFDGQRFENLEPFRHKGLWGVVRWKIFESTTNVPWPDYQEMPTYRPRSQRSHELQFAVINHATVLIQVGGINILTDPHFSSRASPFSWIGPKRHRNPGILFEDLPPIDVVYISHNHYDHMDLKSLVRLEKKFSPHFYAGLKSAEFLKNEGIKKAHDMDWWETIPFQQLQLTFVPSQHWSGRGLFDRRKMLWGGLYLEANGKKVYFAGDTGHGSFFKAIRKKLGPPDVSFLPIGAYRPRWMMRAVHLNPEDAVLAALDLGTKRSFGIHFGTFKLSNEGIDGPLLDLAKALKKHKIGKETFIVPEFGKTYR